MTTVEVVVLVLSAIVLWDAEERLSAWIMLCLAQLSIMVHNRRRFSDDPE